MKAGGNAGAGVQVKIRGVKTFGDNQPLYIIDGFPGDIENVSRGVFVNGVAENTQTAVPSLSGGAEGFLLSGS